MSLPKAERFTVWHERINTILTILVLCVGIGLIVHVVWPMISFHVHKKFPPAHQPAYVSGATQQSTPPQDIPAENRLVIPQLFLNEIIHEGRAETTVNQGPWRKPYSSTPDAGGNTVIAGHRFTYRNKAVFYNLDKLKAGDNFAVYWQGKAYYYKVDSIKVVPPTDKTVEAATSEAQLTLYTCAPVWNPKNRLIVIAKPIGENR